MTKADRHLRIYSMSSPWSAIAPLDDEPDPRPLPSSNAASLALESAVEALSSLFLDTRLEADLLDLLWSFVNLFHRKADRIGRELDDNETAQRRSQAERDG